MADVTGSIGDQQVQLNNAATEATLKQLVNAIGILAAKSGKGAQDTEKELKKFFDQLDKINKSEKKNLNQADQVQKAREKEIQTIQEGESVKEKYARRTVMTMGAIKKLAETAELAATSLTGIISSFANMGNSFSGAASVMGNIPFVGGMLGTVFGAVASAGDKVYSSFKVAATAGANFSGSIVKLNAAASGAGLTLDSYASVVKDNADSLAMFGGSVQQGAKRMTDLAREMRFGSRANRAAQDDLARLGYSAEEINGGFAKYTSMLARSGGLQGKTNDQLIAGTTQYLKQLDAVTRLTGMTRQAQEQENARRMAEAKTRQMIARLGDDAQNFNTLINSLPEGMRKGAEEVFATGAARSKEAREFLVFYGDAANKFLEAGQAARQSGKFSIDSANNLYKSVDRAAKNMDKGFLETTSQFTEYGNQMAVSAYEMQSRTGDLTTVQKEQAKSLAEAKAAQDANTRALDPAQMLRMQQTIAETSNRFQLLLATYLPDLMRAFQTIQGIVEQYVVPAFQWLMENLKTVVIALLATKAALFAIEKAAQAADFYRQFKGPGTSRSNPMFVQDVAGGGKGGGDNQPESAEERRKRREGQRDKLKSSKLAGNLAKGAGVVGAAVSLGMLASDVADINEKKKLGDISERQAKVETGGAVGGAVGTTGGAVGGAMAGAALGSVVPVIGTAVGGLIGAAVGGWLGNNVGSVAGTKIVDSMAKPENGPEWMKINEPNINAWADAVSKGTYKFDQVPDVYKTYVQDILNKKNPGGTPTITTAVNKPMKGTDEWFKVNQPNIDSWTSAVLKGRPIEDVPKVYLPYVLSDVTKKQSATASPKNKGGATAEPAPAKGKSESATVQKPAMEYDQSPEALLREHAQREGWGKNQSQIKEKAKVTIPNLDNIKTYSKGEPLPMAPDKNEIEKINKELQKNKVDKPISELEEKNQTEKTSMAAADMLNTNIATLINLTRKSIDIAERQLSATKSLAGDVFKLG